MESSPSAFSPASLLLCRENLSSIDNEDEEILMDAYDDDYIRTLLDRETASGGFQSQELLLDSWIHKARLDGIHYIFRIRELFRFGFQTAYASVTYLDRFLSNKSINVEKSWAMRLLSMACLSLAAKMEENGVPPLPEFCVGEYYFDSSVIQRMELLVLNALEWKMAAITPFAFLHFFADKIFNDSLPTDGLSRTVDVILTSMRDAKIICHKPSVIAAAATLVVLDKGLKRDALELKIGPLSSIHSVETDNIISCYNLFQEMDIKSPDFSPIQLQPHGSSSASAKRKRLVFNDNEESGYLPDKKGKP